MKPFVAAASILVLAGAASAASVTFTNTVRVFAVEDADSVLGSSAFSNASVGDTGSVTFTYNDAASGTGTNPRNYLGSLSNFSMTIDGQTYSWSFSNFNQCRVQNDTFIPLSNAEDSFWARAFDGNSTDGILGGAIFGDQSLTALSSAALPSAINLSDWDPRGGTVTTGLEGSYAFVRIVDGGQDAIVWMDFDFPVNPMIPLPSAAGLGFAGLAIVGARRRR